MLCAVLWVGGMFFAYVVLRPEPVGDGAAAAAAAAHAGFRRFFLVVWHAMPLIILTGLIMLFRYYGGMSHADLEHPRPCFELGLVMAAIFIVIVFGPYRRFQRTADRGLMVSSLNSIRTMIGINLVLGIVTIVIAMFG